MIKRNSQLILLILIFSVILGCNSKEKEAAKARRDKVSLSDDKLWEQIISNQKKYATDLTWMTKLGFIVLGPKGLRKLYTYEIQDAFLNNKSVLVYGSLQDIKNSDSNNYHVTVSLSSFEREMRVNISPNITFQLICPKSSVNLLKSIYDENYTRNSIIGTRVAVFAIFTEIKDYEYLNSDNENRQGKLLIGECNDIFLAPQTSGYIEKKLKNN